MPFNRPRSLFAAIAFAALSAGGSASATTIQTSALSGWESGLTASTATELSAFASGSLPTLSAFDSETLTSLVGSFIVTGPDNGANALTINTYSNITSLWGANDGSGKINIAPPGSGVNAFLLGIGTFGGSAPITITLSDGESIIVSPTTPGVTTLLGLSVSHPITSIILSTASGTYPVLDDFWYGNSNLTQDPAGTADAPEAATIVLMGGGLLIFFGARRKLLVKTPLAA